MKTYSTKASDIERKWWVIDATDKTLGRLASDVARILAGKHKPIYSPHLDVGDHVIIVNASKVRVTGRKLDQKVYYRHSNYPGGLKSTTLGKMMDIHPTRAIEYAVKGMLPHNRLGSAMFRKLRVYAGADHPHQSQAGSGIEKEA